MYGGINRSIARHDDQCPIMQERCIERGEQVVLKPGVAAEMRLYYRSMRRYCRRRQIGDRQAKVSGLVRLRGKLRHVRPVNKHEPDCRFVQIKTLHVGGLQCRNSASGLKRKLCKWRNIGK